MHRPSGSTLLLAICGSAAVSVAVMVIVAAITGGS